MDPNRLIGRVAKLIGLISKPELNESTVILGSFDVNTQRFAVRTFSDPNNSLASVSVSVKRANLDFFSKSFDEIYANAVVVAGSYTDSIQPGTILDFSQCPPVGSAHEPLQFFSSCSVRGTPFQTGGSGRPTTCIRTKVFIALQDDADVIEFEDINFNIALRGGVSCTGGKHITFRRCQFFSLDSGIDVAEPGTEVVFENCLFDNCQGSGVIVCKGARATLLNCHISRMNMGIEVRTNGSADMIHCTIRDCRGVGATVYAQGQSLSMKFCSILRLKDSGVLVGDGGTITIDGCRMEDCGMAGIAVQGPSRSTALVTQTVATGCQHGMLVQKGKSDVTIEGCKFIKNVMYGMFVGQDAVGEIIMNDTTIAENRFSDINNDGGPKSKLIRNGVELPQDGRVATFARDNPDAAKRIMAQSQRVLREMAQPGQQPLLETLRARKMAGVDTVHCAACDKEEPPKTKFNKCARCLDCCYCSRECQVSHWKEHKAECKKRAKHPQLLDPTKSI